MLDPQLRDYLDRIKKSPEPLPPDDEMRKMFRDAGWSAEEADESIRYLKPPAPPVIPPPLVVPPEPAPAVFGHASSSQAIPISVAAPALPTVVDNPISAPAPAVAPLISSAPSAPQPSAVRAPLFAEQPALSPQPSRSRRGLLVILGLLVVLLVSVVVGYWYAHYKGFFLEPPYSAGARLSEALLRFPDLDAYGYGISFTAETRPVTAETEPLAIPSLGASGPVADPLSFSFFVDLEGVADRRDAASSASEGHLSGAANVSGGVTASFSGDFAREGDDLFLRPLTLPALADGIGDLSGKWVRFSSSDLGKLGYQGSGLTVEKILGGSVLGTPTKDLLEGNVAYRYPLTLAPDALRTVLRLIAGFGYYGASPAELEQFVSSEVFKSATERFEDSSQFVAWFDPNTGLPLKFSFASRIAPGGFQPRLADKEIMLEGALLLSRNEGVPVAFAVPIEPISFTEAVVMATAPRDQYLFLKQRRNISMLRAALEAYRSVAGGYPEDLKNLLAASVDVSGENTPLISSIPSDVYGGAYSYASLGADYRLEYELRLPVFDGRPISLFGIAADVQGVAGVVTLGYVDGKNTADVAGESREALAAAIEDADKDGLTNLFERYVGTDPVKKDTNGNGTSDGDELKSVMQGNR